MAKATKKGSSGARKVLRAAPPAVQDESAHYATGLPRVRRTLVAGSKGTSRLVAQYGDRLLCVRYRYDPARRKRLTTVELVVAQAEWNPLGGVNPSLVVGVRVEYGEADLRERIKAAGGRWDPGSKLWRTSYANAVRLRLADRVVMP